MTGASTDPARKFLVRSMLVCVAGGRIARRPARPAPGCTRPPSSEHPARAGAFNTADMQHRTERTGGEGVDLILDHAGGPTFAECLPATRVDGSVVNIGRLDRAESAVDLDVLSYRHLRVRGVSFGFSWPEKLGAVLSGAVSGLAPTLLDGRVQPLIDSRYDFRTAFEAVRRIASHQALGKIVLAVP